jgi:UDP-glucuronate decarboxylase
MTNSTVAVVAGAAGFIGSHLVDRLLSEGYHVIGVDNFLSGRRENIAHLAENPAFTFIEADVITDPQEYLPELKNLEVVFHLASPASPPRYQAHPVETYLVNSYGTHQLLSFLKEKYPTSRFVFTSTSEVYGDPEQHPQTESYWGNVNPNGVRSCYDEAKRMGETVCGVFSRDFGMDVRIARIFNTYGPRMDPSDGRIIPQFMMAALEGKSLPVYGDGSQTRSFCYVDDLVSGLLALTTTDAASGETINLGNPNEITVHETAEIISNLAGVALNIQNHPLPADDPKQRKPDISKAKTILNWEPTIDREDGFRKTLEYFRRYSAS